MSRAPDPSSPSGAAAARGVASSPWAHFVRGEPDGAPSSLPAPIPSPEPSDPSSLPVGASDTAADAHRMAEGGDRRSGGNATGARGKRPAWNVPANGASEVGPVMGADSWPALSESASRPSARSEGSSIAAPPVCVVAPSQLKLNTNYTNPSSPRNYEALAREKPDTNPNSMKRGGSSSSSSSVNHGSGAHQQPPIFSEMPPVSVDKGQQSSSEDLANKGNGNSDQHRSDEYMPQLQSGNNHRRGSYSSNRRGNSGGAGGSSYHGRYGNRRDHERGGYDWNGPRGFSGRDPHMPMPLPQHRGHSRPFPRPPPPPPPSMAQFLGMPPHMQPFVSPVSYPDIHSHLYCLPPPPPLDTLRGMPFITHQVPPVVPPPMYVPLADHRRFMLVKQIEYYFSPDNLCKDEFLKKKMDDQGWVPISLIACFNRVKQLTNDIPYILDALRGSTDVEVQGGKIRKRGDWMKWILPPTPNQYDSASGPQSPQTPDHDSVIADMHAFALQEGSRQHTTSQTHGIPHNVSQIHNEVLSSRSASGSFNNQMQDATEDGTSQSSPQ